MTNNWRQTLWAYRGFAALSLNTESAPIHPEICTGHDHSVTKVSLPFIFNAPDQFQAVSLNGIKLGRREMLVFTN